MAKKKNTMIVCEKETTNKRKGLFPDLGARVPEISVCTLPVNDVLTFNECI